MDDQPVEHVVPNAVSGASIACNNHTPLSPSGSLPIAFSRVVRAMPEKTAVIDGSVRLSYGELDRLAEVAAVVLIGQGARRGEYLGLHMDRSAAALVAMLAILKIGAAYVPLDPAAPGQRLAAQAASAGIRILAIAKGEEAPAWFTGELLVIDLASTDQAGPTVLLDLHPLELAYVIYTSGSTNEAKGVCIPHRAVLDLVMGANYCGFMPDDVVYHGMSIAFDGSTFEIWGALLTGATLVVAPPRISGKEIGALIDAHGVTVLLLSTGVFNAMGEAALSRLDSIRVLLAGGDVMSPLAACWFIQSGGRVLVNGYGPTEVTTFSHCHVMTSAVSGNAAISIGTPVPGTAAYVLEENGQAVPLETEGELFIAGTGLAQGYLGRPALTAERFLPDPFAADGSRMYRTGDLVRQTCDGRLDYLGRIDTQVKIRGFRVELGEIETVLRATGLLVDACAVHVGQSPSTGTLHAFAALRGGGDPVDEAALLLQLRAVLPDYMVPRTITFLDELPLTINGKVDRRALIGRLQHHTEGAVVDEEAPTRETAELTKELLEGLRRLLGQPQIRASDHFMDVGGDSLSAMRFCAVISEQHGVDVPLATLFEADSLEELFAHVHALKLARRTAAWPT
ncbi:MAG TPA: non-ribosomal peptide synthetase [Ideonella sp.]|uniref:non-ribosomal peptide synthetase n=1 Tax=Ideonella sp. TaxID=1929293 RepID=UPI002CC00538|nr:non-ribosomal peptide synthetase [Ideonella sp.]HSI49717.1 non-ribosomal peptide synthetase [Ideonella sp.]